MRILSGFIILTLFLPIVGLASTIHFRLTADPVTLDWNLARSSYETYIIMNIMEGLVAEGTDLKPRPELAESWEISKDGKNYLFHIRKGVKWSDGKELKAKDFVDSWTRLLEPKSNSSYASFLFDIENAEDFHSGHLKKNKAVGIKAVDDFTLQVRLSRPVSHFLHLLSFWVTFPIRSDLIKKYGSQWAHPGKIATLGPYLLDQWVSGQLIRLKKNPDYFGENKGPDEILGLIVESDRKARALFEEGKLDVLLDATTNDLLNASSKRYRIEKYPYLATYYLGFNVKSAPFRKSEIRKAIALSIDREQIPSILQGGQIAATCWIPPGVEGHHSATHLQGSLYEAKASLARSGYAEGRGFPAISLWVERFDGAQAISKFVASSILEKLGIKVETHIGTSSEFQAVLKSGKEMMFLGHWGADFPDAINFLEIFAPGGLNYTQWSNPEYDNFLLQGREATENGERLKAFFNAEEILIGKETVILPLFYKKNLVLLGPKISRFEISSLNYLFFKSVRLSN